MNTFEFDGKKYKMASIHQKEWGKTLISELKLKGDGRIYVPQRQGRTAETCSKAKALQYAGKCDEFPAP